MDLRHFRHFVILAEELNFTRAAARLHMAQPALSVQMRRLEKEVGTELLCREGRGTKLTDAGRVFLEHARLTLAAAKQSVIAAQQAAQGEIGRLSIGYSTAAEFRIFPTLVPAFKKTWPNVHLSFHQLGALQQIDGLRRDELDVGLTWLPIPTEEFYVVPLTNETFAAVVHANHPFASKASISIKALSREPLVLFARELNPTLYQELEQMFFRAGAEMNVAYELDSLVSLLNFVAMEAGCSVVPEYIRMLSPPGIVFKPLAPPDLVKTLAIVRRKKSSGLAKAFLRFAVESFPAPRK